LQIAKFTPRNFDLLKTPKMPLFTGFVNMELRVYETIRAVMKGSKKSLSLRNVKGTGIAAMSVPFSRYSLFTSHFSLPKGPQSHAARGGDGRQEGRECGYYYLHRNLNDPLLHDYSLFTIH
jgi:hypothetical protein